MMLCFRQRDLLAEWLLIAICVFHFLVLKGGGIPHPDLLPRAAIAESGFRLEKSSYLKRTNMMGILHQEPNNLTLL